MSKVSIIIRTKNEEKGLPKCLDAIKNQTFQDFEIIIVDSGSTDNTLEIAKEHNCKIVEIPQEDFTYGYSLNVGIKNANGKIIVCLSAHCLPVNNEWLERLINPFKLNSKLAGLYGRQIPFTNASPAEKRGLIEAYPQKDKFIIISSVYFSNANCALLKKVWTDFNFNEKLTFSEDQDWCARVQDKDFLIGYEPRAVVYHSHKETLGDAYKKYYLKSKAMKNIKKIYSWKQHSLIGYFLRWVRSTIFDYIYLIKNPVKLFYFLYWIFKIPFYRISVYYGIYKGSK